MATKALIIPLNQILSQIKDIEVVLFRKTDLTAFFKHQAESKTEAELSALFNDLFAFNAYLGRLEGYPSFEAIPYWEYSTCFEWTESHIFSGDSFDPTLKNAKRFFGNIRIYYEYLISLSKMKGTDNLDKAIKEICGGKKLNLVTDIPFTGNETYKIIYKGNVEVRFDIADYWILILHNILFDDDWKKILEAALVVSDERVQKVKELQSKMERLGKSKFWDIAFSDVSRAEAKRAGAWFFGN